MAVLSGTIPPPAGLLEMSRKHCPGTGGPSPSDIPPRSKRHPQADKWGFQESRDRALHLDQSDRTGRHHTHDLLDAGREKRRPRQYPAKSSASANRQVRRPPSCAKPLQLVTLKRYDEGLKVRGAAIGETMPKRWAYLRDVPPCPALIGTGPAGVDSGHTDPLIYRT